MHVDAFQLSFRQGQKKQTVTAESSQQGEEALAWWVQAMILWLVNCTLATLPQDSHLNSYAVGRPPQSSSNGESDHDRPAMPDDQEQEAAAAASTDPVAAQTATAAANSTARDDWMTTKFPKSKAGAADESQAAGKAEKAEVPKPEVRCQSRSAKKSAGASDGCGQCWGMHGAQLGGELTASEEGITACQ